MFIRTLFLASFAIVLASRAQNLVSNGTFQSGNSAFASDYVYSPDDMILGGTYCVVANSASVHFAWTSFGDHTTGSGLMLVVNGDTVGATNTIWRQAIPVATNSAYQFSFWAASSHDDTPAQFAISVNGQVQATTPQLPTLTGSWQQFQVPWSSANSNLAQVEIRLANTNIGATDFVIDDVSLVALPAVRIETAVQLSWLSQSNVTYQVQWAADVTPNQWINLGNPIAGNGTTNTFTDPLGSNQKRFYRVVPLN